MGMMNLVKVPALLLFCFAATVWAEETPDDTDPGKVVFFSVREEYYNLSQDAWINRLIFRSDKTIFKNSNFTRPKGVILRWDLPLVTTQIGSETQSGLGDLYFQGLFFRQISKGFNLAVGPAFVLPTATDNLLGSGKLHFAPLAVPIWFFEKGRGYFLVKVQDFVSLAGSEDRPDVHFMLTTPGLLWHLDQKSWILVDTEGQTNWKNNTTNFKSGLQVGRVFSRHIAFWVKPEIPWGPNRQGDWTIKFTMLYIK